MKNKLKKQKGGKGTKRPSLLKLFLIILSIFIYYYIVFIWTPETYVSTLGQNDIFEFIRYAFVIILSIYTAIQLDAKFLRSQRYSYNQIQDYELWNKFFLHFAFMKTGSGSERAQVLEVLRYLDDSELKQTLTDVYERTLSLKDAHNLIVQKYPYPQVKTFFAESEDALVRGADGSRLMQKTAINIDRYINDLVTFEANKTNSYKMTIAMLVIVVILTLVTKILFAAVFIEFSKSYTGFIFLGLYFIALLQLALRTKRAFYRPLLNFGGDGNE